MRMDPHGGQQMPDGTVSYMGYPNQGYGVMHPQYAPAYPQGYYDPNQHAAQRHPLGQSSPDHQGGKDGNPANLPPPEVARMIPCKFFPNCRYGEKCIFQHPVPIASAGAVSPNASSPPSQPPMFYQPPPGAYGYAPPPYGPPQHFYTMAPPVPMQYSHAGGPVPVHFPPPPPMPGHPMPEGAQMAPGAEPFSPHFQSPHHMHPQQQQYNDASFAQQQQHSTFVPHHPEFASLPPHEQAAIASQSAEQGPQEVSEGQAPAHEQQPEASAGEQNGAQTEQGSPQEEASLTGDANAGAADSVQPASEVSPLGGDAEASAQAPGASSLIDASAAPALDANGRPVHRRQSFNSFLHHHAIPFQPSQPQNIPIAAASQQAPGARVDADGNVVPAPFPRQKGPRRGGASFGGYGRDGAPMGKRAPCTFFARNACKYGDECRFPHILMDGTDARNPNVQRPFYVYDGAAPRSMHRPSKSRNALPYPPSAMSAAYPAGYVPTAPQGKKPAAATVAPAASSAEPSNSEPTPQNAQATLEASVAAINLNGAAISQAAPQPAPAAPRPAANGVNGHAASERPPRAAQKGNAGRSTSANGSLAPAKKVVQRVPNRDDFPALPHSPSGSAPMSPSISGAAIPATSGTKANFSAILSAPAPVRRVSETPATTQADAEKPAAQSATANGLGVSVPAQEGEAAKASAPAPEVNGTAPATTSEKSAVNGDAGHAAGEASADDFHVVKSKHAAKKTAQRPATSATQGDNFAAVAQAKAVAA